MAGARARWRNRSRISGQGRTPEDARHAGAGGLIGPNAVLQLLPLLDAREPGAAARMLLIAGLDGPPSDKGMMPEAPAARLHHAVRAELGPAAPWLLAEAGRATGDYILAHRIPGAARRLLRTLPAALSAPLLKMAISKHAWTFAGSGQFSTRPGLVFEIAHNPVIAGESSPTPLCHWHAAVFERLFRALVDDRLRAQETGCCACGDHACRFELSRAA